MKTFLASILTVLVFGCAQTSCFAQVAQVKPAAPPKAPAITDSQKVAFFKAQAELLRATETARQAQETAQQKQTAFQAAISGITKACGDKFQPSLDPHSGDLVCVAKPEPPAKK